MPTQDPRNPGLTPGDDIGGYHIDKIIEVPEIAAFYYELSHKSTGASHIHISRPDSENAFSIAFKTVPRDSTGIAHILEHTVLCGSRHYPVRDPFFSMMKRSLNTFMNALTASDWTMYPFATQNKKDFYNLLSVYLDSAFYPKLDRLSFKQEGFRIEAEPDPQAPDGVRLVYKGVVFNEMKGAMSSPDQVMARSLLNAVYPDTTYSNNSGGNPAEIPRLTHADLIEFHRHHYHPSNAFFYTYGDLPLTPHLEYIEQNILQDFSRIDPETDVPAQPRWSAPKTATYYYPLDPGESPDRKSQTCVAWLTSDIRDSFEVLVLTVLEQILIGNPGSPLRKALMDSGLGSTLCDGTGYDAENKDTMFACGLKDVDADSAEAVETIIFDVLKDLSENGIDRRLVDTAIHQIEFHRKEVTNSPFPYGLKLLLRFSGDWFHHGDPASALEFESLINRFFTELDSGPLLEDRIRKYFLDNPHRVRMTLQPDRELAERENAREAAELEEIKAGLSEPEISQLKSDAEQLVRLQESEEDLTCLPTLEIEDIAEDIRVVHPTRVIDDPATYCYTQPTAGIFYYTATIGLKPLPADLIPLVPFFCYALTRTGTKAMDYVELARRIDQYTGGLGFSVSAGNRFTDDENPSMPMLSMSGKCLSRNIGNMFDIFHEVLTGYAFSDLNRLKHLLLEIRSDIESSVVHNGHRLAISLAARNFSVSNALNESWHGIHQLKAIKELTEDLSEEKLKTVADNLNRIADALFYRNNIKTALIGEQADIDTAFDRAHSLSDAIDSNPDAGFDPPAVAFEPVPPYEGWTTSTAVSFVAKVVKTKRMDHEDAPVLAVISKLLKSMFLHREIREKGGAYGGFSVYQLETGLFYFGSYRDPHIVNTMAVYEAAADFLVNGDYDDENIKEAILQVCADLDRPDSPGQAASKAFYRRLIGLSDDLRRQFKQQTLSVTRDRVLAAGRKYFAETQAQSAIAVISSNDQLEAANTRLKAPLAIHRI